MTNENETKESKAAGLLAEVAIRIKASGEAVRGRLADKLVENEVNARVDILDKALQKRFELSNNLNKINRADEVKKDADGKVIFESWSDTRREEVKKAKEAIEKHENALEKALSSNDYTKLKGG
jgi:UDP-glucose 6-dehydrogenase